MPPDSLQDEAGERERDNGWLVKGDRSRKVSLNEVDWTYRRRYFWTETGERLPLHPRPPCYYDLMMHVEGLVEESRRSPSDEDVDLNTSLVGVAGAEDVIRRYEEAVGMADALDSCLDEFYAHHRPLFLGELDDDENALVHSQWEELVDQLLGGIFDPGDFTVALDPDYGLQFMTMETASLSDMSLDSDSEALPSTPDAEKRSYAEALFEEGPSYGTQDSPVFSPAPSKPLNASALSFVPACSFESSELSSTLDPPYVSPTYDFHFPSLSKQAADRHNSRSVPLPLQRDEHGFYTEVPVMPTTRSSTPKRPSTKAISDLLDDSPSPIHSRSSSKTREIIDRMRSAAPSRRQKRSKGEASSLRHSVDSTHPSGDFAADSMDADEADGWIMDLSGIERMSGSKTESGWVQGLFQCRSPSRSNSKKKGKHDRTSSTSTVYTTGTPSSPAVSTSSLRGSPMANMSRGMPPAVQPAPFLPFPGAYGAYPGLIPPALVSATAMMQIPQAWCMSMPPAMPPVAFPATIPMYVHRS